jgi:hypothetical protein
MLARLRTSKAGDQYRMTGEAKLRRVIGECPQVADRTRWRASISAAALTAYSVQTLC